MKLKNLQLKTSIAILALIFLSGCMMPYVSPAGDHYKSPHYLGGNVYEMKHYKSNSHDKKNNAVVIIDIIGADAMHLVKFDKNYYDTRTRKDYRITGSTKLLTLGGYRQVVFILEPGIYFISYAMQNKSGTHYYTTNNGITKNGEIIYGAFEVNAGEVVYIGDIKVSWGGSQMMTASYNLDEVKSHLSKYNEYSELVEHIKKGIFYKIGSRIVVDSKGVPKILM